MRRTVGVPLLSASVSVHLSRLDRSRPRRGLRSRRLERRSKDAAKLLLLYDENILDNDPHRDSKDAAFAHSYLSRVSAAAAAAEAASKVFSDTNRISLCAQVCEALQDIPGQVEEFVSLLNRFEQVADGQEVALLFRKLRFILGNRTDLLRDFAAFLHPDQALQCGLVSRDGVLGFWLKVSAQVLVLSEIVSLAS